MTGSMYASIAGLKAHMQKLSVIGNNVANVNTQGYKTARTVFRDSIYRNYKSGANGTQSVGGMNPSQLGYGSLIGSIDIDMSSSSYNPGNPMDCALVGDGFFLVGNKEVAGTINAQNTDSFKSLTLTRVGDFYFDDDGYLVDGNGNCVYGFINVNTATDGEETNGPGTTPGETTGGTITGGYYSNFTAAPGNGYTMVNGKRVPNISDMLVPIRLPTWQKVEVTETGKDDDGNEITTTTSKHIVHYAKPVVDETTGLVTRLEDDTEPTVFGEDATAPGGDDDDTQVEALERARVDNISIAANGAITGYVKGTNEMITIGYLAIGTVANPNGVSHIGNSYYQCGEGAGDMWISMLSGVQNDLGIEYVNGSSVIPQDTEDGADNTETVTLPRGAEITSTGNTSMMVGFLEAPNVDLATEISELITTQRGYQANTRIVTVTDSMLEELVNMKR